jgi:ribosomal protein S12 methylthiotransferase accessory factor YcaO
LALPQILIETLSHANRDRVECFQRAGCCITLFDITLDARIPTNLSVLRGSSPALVLASAADLSAERSVRESLEELEHTRRRSQYIALSVPRLASDPENRNVVDQRSHLNFWCDEANGRLADFRFASETRVEFCELNNPWKGDSAADLAMLLENLKAIDHQLLVCDLITPDVEELGLVVVRTVIPCS